MVHVSSKDPYISDLSYFYSTRPVEPTETDSGIELEECPSSTYFDTEIKKYSAYFNRLSEELYYLLMGHLLTSKGHVLAPKSGAEHGLELVFSLFGAVIPGIALVEESRP